MFDFVTLIYYNQKEFEFLKIQLYSFKFVDINIINNIYILFNDDSEKNNLFTEEYKNNIQKFIPEYLLCKVKIIYITDIFFLDKKYLSNWFTQQFAKIYISNIITSKYYIILDSKNIFIKNVNINTFITNNKINMYYSTHNDILLNYYNNCFNYFEIAVYNPYTSPLYIQTTTPFVFITKECKNLIQFIENKEKTSFYNFFNSWQYTEFFLYFAWLRFTNNDNYIFLNKFIDNIIIGPHDPSIYVWNTWESKINDFNVRRPTTFSISSKCISFIDDEYKHNIIKFFNTIFNDESIHTVFTKFLFDK